MSLNATNVQSAGSSGSFPVMEAGSYPARLAQVIDLGIQPQKYKGDVKPPKGEIMLTYELCNEFGVDEDGKELTDKPRWQSERMPLNNLNSELAKSTKRYEVLDPTGEAKGDFAILGGAPCMVTLNVTENGKYNNISAVTIMRKKEAEKLANLVQEPKIFTLDDPDMTIFGSLPEWVQGIIKKNLDFEGSKLAELLGEISNSNATSAEDDGEW